jgi:anti-anti-sigma factor
MGTHANSGDSVYKIKLSDEFIRTNNASKSLLSEIDKAKGHKTIRIDLSELRYVDSSFADTLVLIRKQFPDIVRKIVLLNPTSAVEQMIYLVQFDKIFQIVRTQIPAF